MAADYEHMAKRIMSYPAIIEQGESSGLSVFFPDLPGLASGGDTLDAAKENAETALAMHLGAMLEYGQALPSPSRLEELETDPEVRELARVLVRVEMPLRRDWQN